MDLMGTSLSIVLIWPRNGIAGGLGMGTVMIPETSYDESGDYPSGCGSILYTLRVHPPNRVRRNPVQDVVPRPV